MASVSNTPTPPPRSARPRGRAGLFTGMMPSMAGAYTNTQPLGDTVLTMGQRFSAAGYRCGYIGKWHLDGYDYFGTGECPPGWEDALWHDGRRYLTELSPEEVTLWRRGLTTLKDLKENQITSEFTWAHRIADRAERFLGDDAWMQRLPRQPDWPDCEPGAGSVQTVRRADAESGERFNLNTDGTLTLPLKRHDIRLLRVLPAADGVKVSSSL